MLFFLVFLLFLLFGFGIVLCYESTNYALSIFLKLKLYFSENGPYFWAAMKK